MSEDSQYYLILLSIIIMVILASSVILIFYLYNRKVIQTLKEGHERELNYQHQLHVSNIETQENERARIARDLHDDIGSKLNIINLNFSLLKSAILRKEDYSEILNHISLSLSESIERSRAISHELLPPILTKFGLQSAINALATKINKLGDLTFITEIVEDWSRLDKIQELHIYRIIQELVNNTLKHAQAKTITLSSNISEKELILHYKDDGKGITHKDNQIGLGIDNIRIRVEIMKGEMDIQSQVNQGAEIILKIPLS